MKAQFLAHLGTLDDPVDTFLPGFMTGNCTNYAELECSAPNTEFLGTYMGFLKLTCSTFVWIPKEDRHVNR